jgi:tetratricopeptide (TPR) repeat protein
VLFWSAWPLLVLLPTLVIPLNVLVNEHRLYIPGMAFALGVATLLGAFIQRRGKVGLAFSLLGLGIFCALDAQRTRVWASEETLWQDALRKSPLMPRPHLYMGHVLQEAGMREQALREYQQALTVYPEILSGGDVLSIYNNMGAAYLAMGRNREAIAAYGRALQIDSTYARARQSLEALLALQQTERQSQANALHQKGLLLMIGGQVEQAVEAFRNSLDIQPWEETYMALAQAHERLEDWEQASQAYAELLALSPQGAFAQRARQRLEELRGK